MRIFEETDIPRLEDKLMHKVRDTIQRIPEKKVLGVDIDSLVEEIAATVLVEPVHHHLDKLEVSEPKEIRQYSTRTGREERMIYVEAYLPVSGNLDALRIRPMNCHLDWGRPELRDSQLTYPYQMQRIVPQHLRHDITRHTSCTAKNIERLAEDLEQMNARVQSKIPELLRAKVSRLNEAKAAISSLGLPLRRRTDAPTIEVPIKRRRRISVSRVDQPSPTVPPEHVLSQRNFETIMEVLGSMVRVMERSPGAFSGMDEEAIRFHFLMQLNGQFELTGVGEAFSCQGKSDIMLLVGGRAVFIAECKNWKGPQSLTEALDQLFGYLCWRDTKCALLFFVRNKDFGRVVEQFAPVTAEHPLWRQTLGQDGKAAEYRFRFQHPKNSSASLWLTVMGFHIPK